MKYSNEIIINLPRERVIELFDSTENLYKWQSGLKSFEPVSGEHGQPGAVSKLQYDMNGRHIEMTETITSRNLPDEFSGIYEAKSVKNWITNRFYEDQPGKTRWVTENEFRFSGMMRIISFFMRGSFPRQTLKIMNDFKAFAENA